MTKIETFKCATGSGWGILVDGMMDCDIAYSRTEREAFWLGSEAYPDEKVLTTADMDHYSNAELREATATCSRDFRWSAFGR